MALSTPFQKLTAGSVETTVGHQGDAHLRASRRGLGIVMHPTRVRTGSFSFPNSVNGAILAGLRAVHLFPHVANPVPTDAFIR